MSVSNRSGIVGIETEVVRANPAHHKAHSICYAGYHNEGVGTYGRYRGRFHSKRYIKRQFIGHSSYMNPITDPFMKKMLKLYLFDSVFLTRKV